MGYVNVEYGCATDHRIRDDGDLLNRESFNDWSPPIFGNILSISVVLLSVIIATLL